ncbi:protein HypA [Ditylenchus destructor]|nr:protein HypA [Ditylenchus destructor]
MSQHEVANQVEGWTAFRIINIENTGKKVYYYESDRTKLRVAVCPDPKASVVEGSVALLTPAKNDDGVPHACEHAVLISCKKFAGTRQLLDRITSLNFGASSSNAATYQEYTDYECMNMSEEGFLRYLELLLHHILDPELSESGFLTDVYHIDHEGERGGAVYRELPEFDGSMTELTSRDLRRAMHPRTPVYYNESGGIRSRLANLSNQTLKQYVDEYYHLNNMLITVCGNVTVGPMITKIGKIEEYYAQKYPGRISNRFCKPFPAPVQCIESPGVIEVNCPAVDLRHGFVEMGFFVDFSTEVLSCHGQWQWPKGVDAD